MAVYLILILLYCKAYLTSNKIVNCSHIVNNFVAFSKMNSYNKKNIIYNYKLK